MINLCKNDKLWIDYPRLKRQEFISLNERYRTRGQCYSCLAVFIFFGNLKTNEYHQSYLKTNEILNEFQHESQI